MTPHPYKIAVIGCGITGSTFTSELLRHFALSSSSGSSQPTIRVYDQGRAPGGRCSSRLLELTDPATSAKVELTVDHGCQFFRSDLEGPSRQVVSSWTEKGWIRRLDSLASTTTTSTNPPPLFFGFPSLPPFYYPASGGMVGVVSNQVASWPSDSVTVSSSSRVNSVSFNSSSSMWEVEATTGRNAIHDTADKDMVLVPPVNTDAFDCVVFTDVSSTTFTSWHRASALGNSASVPQSFLDDVASRLEVSGRVPLFSCIVVFSKKFDAGVDAVTFGDDYDSAWFCCRSSAKLGDELPSSSLDAWVVVSTPKVRAKMMAFVTMTRSANTSFDAISNKAFYIKTLNLLLPNSFHSSQFGVDEIRRVPMQTEDGQFIPQDKGYLRSGPCQDLLSDLRKFAGGKLPEIVHVDGQRWGSALPGVKFDGREVSSLLRCTMWKR